MKRTRSKKIIAVFAVFVMLVLSCSSAFAASASSAPVIYIPDMTEIRYFRNPNSPYDTEREAFSLSSNKMRGNIASILTGLLSASDDPAKGSAQIASVIDDIFVNIKMDEKGNAVDPAIGIIRFERAVSNYTEEYIYSADVKAFVSAASSRITAKEVFFFNYDWRIDVSENAALLKSFIEKVKSATGKKQVSILARGYGGAVANAYAYYNIDHAKESLASFVLLDSLVTGNSLIGDVMSGRLVRSFSEAIEDLGSFFEIGDIYSDLKGEVLGEALARYVGEDPAGIVSTSFANIFGDSNYSKLIATLILRGASLIIQNEGMFTKIGSGYRDILSQADATIYSKGLREYLRNIPGLWAVIPAENYNSAISFLFGKETEIPAELLTKIENGRRVLERTDVTLHALQNAGVNLDVVAGYNRQMLPITASINEQSDGFQATRYSGIGATTVDVDKTLRTEARCKNGNHIHMEPGRTVDAATCYFPENTWFIKNHTHISFSEPTTAAFVAWLVFSDTQRTVWQNENYPQFLQSSLIDDKLSALSNYTDGSVDHLAYGDLDVDGVISPADARLALRYAVGLEDTPSRIMEMIADVDGADGITPADARFILRYAVGLEKRFPVDR